MLNIRLVLHELYHSVPKDRSVGTDFTLSVNRMKGFLDSVPRPVKEGKSS